MVAVVGGKILNNGGCDMLTFFKDITSDADITLSSFYGLTIQPDPKYKKKLEKAIQTLGDRYVLFKEVPRRVQ
jgi:hypothetical protein